LKRPAGGVGYLKKRMEKVHRTWIEINSERMKFAGWLAGDEKRTSLDAMACPVYKRFDFAGWTR
jgi:hypothetical protein